MQKRLITATMLALVLGCAPLTALAECPGAAKSSGDAAMDRAWAILEEMESSQEPDTTVLLTEPGTGTTVTPGAAPQEPRQLTADELERMQAARPDPDLPPALAPQ